MRKTLLLCLGLGMASGAFAQDVDSFPAPLATDTSQIIVFDTPLVMNSVPVNRADTSLAPPATKPAAGVVGGVNLWFLALLGVIVAGFILWGLRVRFGKEPQKIVRRKTDSNPETMPTEYYPAPAAAESILPAQPARPVVADTVVVQEPVMQPVAAPPVAEAAAPDVKAPEPEIFYMTVPGADGSFAAGAKKSHPSGCLYKFVVAPETPEAADIFFAGNETDMRNAQAFRDLELLPVCTFSGMPDTNNFRFTQKPGRAVFDGNAWQVKMKIAIVFG